MYLNQATLELQVNRDKTTGVYNTAVEAQQPEMAKNPQTVIPVDGDVPLCAKHWQWMLLEMKKTITTEVKSEVEKELQSITDEGVKIKESIANMERNNTAELNKENMSGTT